MCLYVTSKTPKKVKFKNGKVTCYKVVRQGPLSALENRPEKPTRLGAIYQDYEYKPGFNKASGTPDFSYWSFDLILNGGCIHVCTSKRRAIDIATEDTNSVVIPVMCFKKDFVAEGKNSEAAFTQIFISKETYKKALKAKNKRALI